MDENSLVKVLSTSVEITSAKDSSVVGIFEPVRISTSFSLGSIPTCTAVLVTGSSFDNTRDTFSITEELAAAHTAGGLNVSINFDISVGGKARTVCVFKGIISEVSLTQTMSPYGGSSAGVSIRAHHKFAELYRWGTNGMVYACPNDVFNKSKIQSLRDAQNARNAEDRNRTSTNATNIGTIETVLKRCCPISGSSDKRQARSIAYTLNDLITEMSKNKILIPNTPINLDNYLDGTTAIAKNIPSIYNLTKEYLTRVWDSVNASSIGNTLISILTSRTLFLTTAPRSTDKLTIIPDNGCTIRKAHPRISKNMYTGISYRNPISLHPEPEGVLITAPGSDTNAGILGDAVRGRCPDGKGDDGLLWITEPAPRWLITDYGKYAADNKNSASILKGNVDAVCKQYAQWMYNKVIHRNNQCAVSADIRLIEAFKALGSVCEINTDVYGDIKGMFYAYSMSYSQSAKSCNMSVELQFSHITQYINNTDTNDIDLLYTVGDDDIIETFPYLLNVDED